MACHNTPADCWVSLLGAVYDVSRLLRDYPGPLTEPILAAAGTDISHWYARTAAVLDTHHTWAQHMLTQQEQLCWAGLPRVWQLHHCAVLNWLLSATRHVTLLTDSTEQVLCLCWLMGCRFDAATGDVRYHVDPETQLRVPYCPQVWQAAACMRCQLSSSSPELCCILARRSHAHVLAVNLRARRVCTEHLGQSTRVSTPCLPRSARHCDQP